MRGNLLLNGSRNKETNRYRKKSRNQKLALLALAALGCYGLQAQSKNPIQAPSQPYKEIPGGIELRLPEAQPAGQYLRLQFATPSILHVMARPDSNFVLTPTLMIEQKPQAVIDYQITTDKNLHQLRLTSRALQASVDLSTGKISYLDKNGKTLLSESAEPRQFTPVTIAEPGYYSITQQFDNVQNSPLYGLGGNQLGYTDLRGKNLEMIQYNANVFNPYLVSTGHFGLLWNNSSITYYGHPEEFQPLDKLNLFNKQGEKGALTATYIFDTTKPAEQLTRQEKTIGYRFAKDTSFLPAAFKIKMAPHSKVIWEGQIASDLPRSDYDFILKFGGYIKVWLDNELVVDWWRQPWNPAETPFSLNMEPHKKYQIKVEWYPDGAASFANIRQKRAPREQDHQIRFHSEAGQQIDYYMLTGLNIDSLISGYRYLTGKAPIMPKWAYGFWQSKEHYNSQEEILATARAFREKQIPIDNIVQDWYYWKEDDWGSQQFDTSRYPDPAAMTRELHKDYHLHFMISVWPKFYENSRYFKKFWDNNWLYKQNILEKRKDWMGYVSTFYDAFNPDAGKAFWSLVNKNIYSKGVDAWWLDATEPDIVDNITNDRRMELMTPTYAGAPQINFNAYALAQDKTFYEGQRSVDPNKRVFILTRSAFAGAQRYAASTWSGDIGATWQEMHRQIATGISFSMAGIPYWSMDIGGFAVESKYQHPGPALEEDWRELQTRWYQFGAFSPIFRSHGQAPAREMFHIAPDSHPAYKSMLYYDQLRYRLMPYIYSMGAATYFKDYTPMRGLAMDFPQDTKAAAVKDAYMFGPALLIAPVCTPHATAREVYLPDDKAAKWYQLYTGKAYDGGQTIQADAPYERMPVFVAAGSILPTGPITQHTGPLADTLDIYVYGGKDGQFTLYEDQGTNYDYEKGDYRKIPLHYQDQTGRLLIDAPQGQFKEKESGSENGTRKGNTTGAPQKTFRIYWVRPGSPAGVDTQAPPTRTVQYKGEALQVQLK